MLLRYSAVLLRVLIVAAIAATTASTFWMPSARLQADTTLQGYTPEFEYAGCLIDLPSWVFRRG